MKLNALTATGIRSYQDVLPNGLTVVTVEMPHLHSVELSLFVRSGLRFETKANNGISHFLEHMLFRGNKLYPDSIALSREFERIGQDLRASTLSEYTQYEFNPHPMHLERAVELFAEFFTDPTYPALEVERQIILEEYLEDLNAEGDNVDINNLACRLLYPDDPLSWPTIGEQETIKAIDARMLEDYFRTYYVPGNMVLSAAGVLDHTIFLPLAEKHFGQLKGKPIHIPDPAFNLIENQSAPALLLQENEGESQNELQVCFRAYSYNHPDFFTGGLISRIFDDGVSSRLQRNLREEKGLVYSLDCRPTSLSDIGTFDFDVTVRPEKVVQVLELILSEICALRDDGPLPGELEHVQSRYIYELDQEQDEPGRMVVRYGLPVLYSEIISLEEERERILGITDEDIVRVARELFVPEKLNVVVVGPKTRDVESKINKCLNGFS